MNNLPDGRRLTTISHSKHLDLLHLAAFAKHLSSLLNPIINSRWWAPAIAPTGCNVHLVRTIDVNFNGADWLRYEESLRCAIVPERDYWLFS